MEHLLVVEHGSGCYEARCSCGGWRLRPMVLRVGQLREVLPRMQAGHGRHVREAATAVEVQAREAVPV